MARALIVDDSKVMRFHIKKLLKELGHSVTAEASNGFESIEAYKRTRADFVTMDLEMPTSNNIGGGLDAVEELMKINPNVVIIMVSSQTDQDRIKEALKKGAKNYLNKPITSEKLQRMIQHLGLK